jgi:AefR-like transcriptional repressor, C-terminal domain
MEIFVHSGDQSASQVRPSPDLVRRQVVDMATDAQRGDGDGGTAADPALGRGRRIPGHEGGHAATDLYLALLQDRLPVYAQTMKDLRGRAGQAGVPDNLLPVAAATLDFYCGMLGAKVSVIADPEQLVRLRDLMKARGLGPAVAQRVLADYLRDEQQGGRMTADVAAESAASLLIGGCLSYAFDRLLMGEEGLPPRDAYVAGLVRGLRLAA